MICQTMCKLEEGLRSTEQSYPDTPLRYGADEVDEVRG